MSCIYTITGTYKCINNNNNKCNCNKCNNIDYSEQSGASDMQYHALYRDEKCKDCNKIECKNKLCHNCDNCKLNHKQ